jgi:hypothetical protein
LHKAVFVECSGYFKPKVRFADMLLSQWHFILLLFLLGVLTIAFSLVTLHICNLWLYSITFAKSLRHLDDRADYLVCERDRMMN